MQLLFLGHMKDGNEHQDQPRLPFFSEPAEADAFRRSPPAALLDWDVPQEPLSADAVIDAQEPAGLTEMINFRTDPATRRAFEKAAASRGESTSAALRSMVKAYIRSGVPL
jgi:hypothetical protein